jgi:hypothetical protein
VTCPPLSCVRYWKVGQYISRKLESAEWGDGVIDDLARYLAHRGLNCLVAVELKAARFEPEHLGKLNFYLEALDRDVRKPHENPTIGLLLCATKDSEVVEYALSRALSPAMIAEYETQLPDKKLLRAKLHEFYQLLAPPDDEEGSPPPIATKRNGKGATE